MSLLTGKTFSEIHSLYSLEMSPAASKNVLSMMANLQKNRGWKGLFLEIERNLSLLETLITKSRGAAIRDLNAGKGLLKGQWVHFERIALRSGKFKKLALAMNLLDIRGYFTHPEATIKDYKRDAKCLSEKINPLTGTRDFTVTNSTIKRIDELLAGRKLDWLTDWANKNLTYDFDLPYPYSSKNIMVNPWKKLPGFAVTPDDLLESTWLFPSLMVDFYDFWKSIIGDRLPDKAEYEIAMFEPSDDIGGSYSILNKDDRMKQRGVSPFTYLLQYACHPLRMVLKQMLKKHPSSYIENQLKGVQVVYKKLKAGVAQSSIDVKTASDNLSLQIQIRLLRKTLPKGKWKETLISIFERACHMRLLTPYDGVEVSHKLGGPMGLEGVYDSFAWELMYLLSQKLPLDAFVGVGDDIDYDSIYDPEVQKICEDAGIPLSLQKCRWNSDNVVKFCNRMITRFTILGTYKASSMDQENPMPSLIRYGKSVLDLFPNLSSAEKQQLIAANVLKDRTQSLAQVTYQYDDYAVASGGYSPIQLKRMGVMSSRQYFVMKYLIGLIHSKQRVSPEEFLALTLTRELKDKRTGKKTTIDIVVRDEINFPKNILPRSCFDREVHSSGYTWLTSLTDIFVWWNHMLQIDVEDELLIRPGYNPPSTVLFASLITSVSDSYKKKGIPFGYKPVYYEYRSVGYGITSEDFSFLTAPDPRARDNLKPLAKLLSANKAKSECFKDLEVLNPDISPLESDLRKGRSLLESFRSAKNSIDRYLSTVVGGPVALGRYWIRRFFGDRKSVV